MECKEKVSTAQLTSLLLLLFVIVFTYESHMLSVNTAHGMSCDVCVLLDTPGTKSS